MSNKEKLFKNTAIGLIPEDWDISEVNQLGNIVTGTTPKTIVPEYYNGDYMFISPGDINNNKYVKKTQKHLSEKGLTVSRILPKNTVLVVCIGATIGKVAMTEAEISTTNQQINAVIPNQKVNADYLYYALKYRSPYLPALAGRAAVPILNKSNFGRFLIPLPRLPEQKSIAHTLRTIQKAKETRQRELELERERKAALMEYLFTHGTRNEARKQTEIGEIPESWEVVILEDMCLTIVDCPHTTPKLSPIGIRTVKNVNVRDGRFLCEPAFYTTVQEYEERTKRLEPNEGDVLFSREAPVGEACLVPPNTKLSLGQRLMLLRTNSEKLNNFFLVQAFYSSYLKSKMLSISGGVTAPHLNVSQVKKLKIFLPNISEQKEIAHILKSCDTKIQALEKEISLTDELFQATLEKLMTGKISTQPLIEV